MKKRNIGIMGAMPEEIEGVIALLDNSAEKTIGMRTYASGTINGIDTVVVFSRWGKVAAAVTASTLIHEFGITELCFIGVAGAIDSGLNIGDIVVASRLIQHDMDARPLMPRHEIPLLAKTFFESDTLQTELISKAIYEVIENKNLQELIDHDDLDAFNIRKPKLAIGDIASGDQFFASENQKEQLLSELPSILCVEMEGAPVAQVCFEYGIPFAVIRTISDTADDSSHIDFPLFIKKISSQYSVAIISKYYSLL